MWIHIYSQSSFFLDSVFICKSVYSLKFIYHPKTNTLFYDYSQACSESQKIGVTKQVHSQPRLNLVTLFFYFTSHKCFLLIGLYLIRSFFAFVVVSDFPV